MPSSNQHAGRDCALQLSPNSISNVEEAFISWHGRLMHNTPTRPTLLAIADDVIE